LRDLTFFKEFEEDLSLWTCKSFLLLHVFLCTRCWTLCVVSGMSQFITFHRYYPLEDIGIEPLLDNPSVGHSFTDHAIFPFSNLGVWGK